MTVSFMFITLKSMQLRTKGNQEVASLSIILGNLFYLSSVRVRPWLKSRYSYNRDCRCRMMSFQSGSLQYYLWGVLNTFWTRT
ncbi:hypothetical protein RHSIM_RhsimUnG0012000 [Rhododendron simsii]|uniref:Uncharacterized protein n=1 Tax=Rhododendron simsii TaxID=118357 RepID=A0A834G020_RHOSS|nr:hypothetical protein RHSIM_RhsimUnG0012000 [Rhododendron simsii]